MKFKNVKQSGSKPKFNKNFKKKPKENIDEKQPKQSLNEDEEIKLLQTKYSSIDTKNITLFTELPLSKKTLKGLKKNNFINPTAIQKESIAPALQGKVCIFFP